MPKLAGTLNRIVKLPPNMAAGGWDIDTERLQQFMEHFGIVNPIHFRWTKGYYTTGCHRLTVSGKERKHGITMNQWRDIEDSRITILHELCHAIQKDTVELNAWISRQKSERSTYGYENSPIEIEAREFAANNVAEWGDILY